MIECLFVGAGGFVGAILRYLMCLIPIGNDFPVMTLIVNVLAAIFIGAVSEIADTYSGFPSNISLSLKTGVCGGFSTLSALSLETVELFESGHGVLGAGYAFLSVVLCVGGVLLGRFAAAIITK